MKSNLTYGFALTFVAAHTALALPREVPGNTNLPRLISESNLVVLGRVEKVDESDKKNATAQVGVEKIYKGSASGVIEITFDASAAHCARPRENDRAIFFLKKSESNEVLTDCFEGKLPVAFSAPESSAGEGAEDALAKDVVKGLDNKDRTSRVSTIQQLVGLRRKETAGRIKELIRSDDPEVKFTAHWALLKLGDRSELGALVSGIKKDTPIPSPLRWNLANAIENIQAPDSTAEVIQLTNSDDPSLVLAAACALRNIKSPKAVARLVELLDSPDRKVNYCAIAALDAVEHGESAETPSVGVFSKNPSVYVDQWKKWWETSGKKKYGK